MQLAGPECGAAGVPRGCRWRLELPPAAPPLASPCRDRPHRERNLLIFLTLIGISFFGSQSEQADGDGNYNIMVDFNTSPPTFDGGEVLEFTLAGVVGLTADDFAFLSDEGGGQGTYFSAAKIQNSNCISGDLNGGTADPKTCNDTGPNDNEGSDWLGAVPEPGALALFATSLIVASGLTRRRSRAH